MLYNNTSDIKHDTFLPFPNKISILYVGQRNSFLFLSFKRSIILAVIVIIVDYKCQCRSLFPTTFLIAQHQFIALEYNLLHLQVYGMHH